MPATKELMPLKKDYLIQINGFLSEEALIGRKNRENDFKGSVLLHTQNELAAL